jgi:hypothetical protein
VTRYALDKMKTGDAALDCIAEPELARILLQCSSPGCKSHAIVYALKEHQLKPEGEWEFSGVLCDEGHPLIRAVRVSEDGIP